MSRYIRRMDKEMNTVQVRPDRSNSVQSGSNLPGVKRSYWQA
ncbi:hypothetical protein OROMI_005160 [Orobanche minor]